MNDMSDKNQEHHELVIEFKDPDGCAQFFYWATAADRQALIDDGMDEDEAADRIYEEHPLGRFFRYGEYGCVKLRLNRNGKGTCELLPMDE